MYFTRTFLAVAVAFSFFSVPAAHAGLLAYYFFDTSLTNDDSGNGLNLSSAGGGLSQVSGQFGQAASFSSNSYLFRASASDFNFGNSDFSVSYWYQRTSGIGFAPTVSKNSSSSDQGWASWLTSTTVNGDFRDTTTGLVSGARPGTDSSQLHHVVFQRSGSDLQLYLDGTLIDTDSLVSNVDTSNAFPIGSRNITSGGATTGGSLFYTGLIDEVFIFDNALNATEISNLNQFNDINGAVVEPASFAGFAVGLVGLGLLRRRARR